MPAGSTKQVTLTMTVNLYDTDITSVTLDGVGQIIQGRKAKLLVPMENATHTLKFFKGTTVKYTRQLRIDASRTVAPSVALPAAAGV